MQSKTGPDNKIYIQDDRSNMLPCCLPTFPVREAMLYTNRYRKASHTSSMLGLLSLQGTFIWQLGDGGPTVVLSVK